MIRKPRIAFIGDLTVDTYVDSGETRLGGAALNGAIWANRHGALSSVYSAIGSDISGQTFASQLKEIKLDGSGIQLLEGTTSSIDISIDSRGEKSYGTWNPGVLRHFHIRGMDILSLHRKDAIIATVYPPFLHILNEIRSLHVRKNASPNIVVNFGDLREFAYDFSIVEQYSDGADICVFGLDKDSDENLINRLREFSTLSSKMVLITLASYGSLLYVHEQTYLQPAEHTDIVDTTGAGDAFLSGFMVEYCKKKDIQKSLIAGTQVASEAISRLGAY